MPINADMYGEDGELLFPGHDFNQYWRECIENGYLSERQQKQILENYFAFIKETTKSLFVRLPEMKFVLQQCSFADPARRKQKGVSIRTVVSRFNNSFFSAEDIEEQYRKFTNDSLLDFEYEETAKKDPVAFWCLLYKNYEEYRSLAKQHDRQNSECLYDCGNGKPHSS